MFFGGPKPSVGLIIVAGALVAALVLGGIAFAGASLLQPTSVDPEELRVGLVLESGHEVVHVIEPAPAGAPQPERGGPQGKRIEEILDKLVQNGTITADQKTKILQALREAAKGAKGGHPGAFLGELLVDAAKAIGITPEQLKQELPGKSLAQVAQAHGVSRADLIAKLTAAATARIDKAVADSKLTADQAAKLKSGLAERIARFVDKVRRSRQGI